MYRISDLDLKNSSLEQLVDERYWATGTKRKFIKLHKIRVEEKKNNNNFSRYRI